MLVRLQQEPSQSRGTRGIRIVNGAANGHSGGIQNPRAVNGNGGGRGDSTTNGNMVSVLCLQEINYGNNEFGLEPKNTSYATESLV